MPTETSKLDDLLDALAEYAGDSKEKQREVGLKLLDKDGTKAIGEVLLKKGLSKRAADATGKASELEGQLKELRDENAELKQQNAELQAKEPNWNRRLEEEAKKWQGKLDQAEARVTEERQRSLTDQVGIARQKFQAALRIGQEGGVDEDFGRFIPAEYQDRFVPDPETRTVKVLEIGEKDSFYDPAEGEPAEQLARDVIAKLPPKARIMGSPEGGGGVQNGNGGLSKSAAAIRKQKESSSLYTL